MINPPLVKHKTKVYKKNGALPHTSYGAGVIKPTERPTDNEEAH